LYDHDTKLVRFGARDYEPATGRWTAKDPVLFGGRAANLFTYVLNDPISLSDPSGQIAPILAALAGAAVIGGAANVFNALQAGKTDPADLAEAFGVGAVGGVVGLAAALASDNPWVGGAVSGAIVTAGNRYLVGVTNADNVVLDFGIGVGTGALCARVVVGTTVSTNAEGVASGTLGIGASAIINAFDALLDSLSGATLQVPESPGQ
jgi:RHS repeat-associated protein